MISKLKIIKMKCKDCMPEKGNRGPKSCKTTQCALFDYKLGKDVHKSADLALIAGKITAPPVFHQKRGYLRAIRSYCGQCCNGDWKEVELCPAVKCGFYPYRFGKNQTTGVLNETNIA